MSETKKKSSYIGAPAHFALEMACKQIHAAFVQPLEPPRHGTVFLVGSALERPDWRDVDIRLMLDDESFRDLFPGAIHDADAALWESDPRWTLMIVALSNWMRKETGLPIDFQIQPTTWANKRHNGRRDAMGMRYVR